MAEERLSSFVGLAFVMVPTCRPATETA